MPAKPLTTEQIAKVDEWIRTKMPGLKTCPGCQQAGSYDNSVICAMLAVEPGKKQIIQAGIAVVPIVCKQCGHTAMVEAQRLGLIGEGGG